MTLTEKASYRRLYRQRVAGVKDTEAAYSREYRRRNVERVAAADKERKRRPAARSAHSANQRKRYAKNPAPKRAANARWRTLNAARFRGVIRAWRERNKYRTRAYVRAYQAAKANRLPVWADLNEIARIYKACPPGYHVDHDIPLRGKHVSGLHVPANLVAIPALENFRKQNRWPTQPPRKVHLTRIPPR